MIVVEQEWKSYNLRCIALLNITMLHRCGYVGVPKEHPFYGISYCDVISDTLLDYFKKYTVNSQIGKRSIIDILCCDTSAPHFGILFDVHGGITYSRNYVENVKRKGDWFFGFDCGHCDNAIDLNAIDKSLKQVELKIPFSGIVRSKDFVVCECESLAKQINNLSKVMEVEQ